MMEPPGVKPVDSIPLLRRAKRKVIIVDLPIDRRKIHVRFRSVRDAFGQAPERIAGFMFIGTPSRPLEERPRPDFDAVVSDWTPKAP